MFLNFLNRYVKPGPRGVFDAATFGPFRALIRTKSEGFGILMTDVLRVATFYYLVKFGGNTYVAMKKKAVEDAEQREVYGSKKAKSDFEKLARQ